MGKGVNLQEATSPSTPNVTIDAYRKSQGQNKLELPPKRLCAHLGMVPAPGIRINSPSVPLGAPSVN